MWTFYTQHVLERMDQRGISKDAIEHIWSTWVHVIDDESGKITVEGVYSNKNLRVIAQNKWKHTILITTYFYD